MASQFASTQRGNTTSLAQLLNAADTHSSQFNSLHAISFSHVQSVSSAYSQLVNLSNLPDSGRTTRSGRGEGNEMKERGMIKVREVIEEGLRSVRDELGKMESVVEAINTLLFDADLFLSTPNTALQHGLNPSEALKHVSALHASYADELIRLREILADFTTEEIGIEAFVEEWRVMKEVDVGKEVELGELNDIMGSWGAADSEMS